MNLVEFWFEPRARGAADAELLGHWFGVRPEFDAQMRTLFEPDLEAALAGAPSDPRSAREALRLVLLFDQVPRNIYRGSARVYAYDARALAIVRRGLAAGLDRGLEIFERIFFLFPLMHAESLADQHEMVERVAAMEPEVPSRDRALWALFLKGAHEHRDLIRRFGRFPHRNEALLRISTPEELAHMNQVKDAAASDAGDPAKGRPFQVSQQAYAAKASPEEQGPPYAGWAALSFHAICEGGAWREVEEPPRVHPASVGLQFGHSVFEGMRAVLRPDGTVHAFRASAHRARFARSCERLQFVAPDQDLFRRALRATLLHRSQWEAPRPSRQMYIRPIVYNLTDHIFPVVGDRFGFSVHVAPVGSFQTPENYRLAVQRELRRVADPGLGDCKTAANYAPLLAREAAPRSSSSHLWIDSGDDPTIDEANTGNLFLVLRDAVLVTPPPGNRILPGITRLCVMDLARGLGLEVEEREVRLAEIYRRHESGELTGLFLTSTGVGVQAVHVLRDGSRDERLPVSRRIAELSQRYQQALAGELAGHELWAEPVGTLPV